MGTNVLEDHTAFVFTATLKIEAVYFSAALVAIYQSTRCHRLKDHIMNLRRQGNHISMKSLLPTHRDLIKADEVLLVVEVKRIFVNNTLPSLNNIVLFNKRLIFRCMTLIYVTYKHSVRTSQETHCVYITETSRLMLFRDVIAICCEKHAKHINRLFGKIQSFLILKYAVH
jgi:hypothetical protein